MHIVSRTGLLQQLELVSPGLSPHDVIEQSSCFVFKNKQVITFNDEVACSLATDLDFTAAVPAALLLSLLRKMPEDEIEIGVSDGELNIGGKSRDADIRIENEITLPVEHVEQATSWRKLPADFAEAVSIVQQCAGRDDSNFSQTCVHIHPKWVEACDNFQAARYRLKTGVAEPTLVRQSSLKHITTLGMTEIAETESYIHFRGSTGLVVSCRRYLEDFLDLTPYITVEGTPAVLPKGLADACELAEIFSIDNPDANQVLIDLKPGKLRIKGQGAKGQYNERKKIKYDGPPLRFMVAPKLLAELTKQHNDCELTENRLKVTGSKYVFVTCLGQEDDEN